MGKERYMRDYSLISHLSCWMEKDLSRTESYLVLDKLMVKWLSEIQVDVERKLFIESDSELDL